MSNAILWYKLDENNNPVPCENSVEYNEWRLAHPDKVRVAASLIGGAHVSTVFLGLDHNWIGNTGPPILFETMIFEGEHDGYQVRCSTYEDALKQHEEAVRLVSPNPLKKLVDFKL